MELRPFASLDDLLCKVNGASVLMRNRLSAKAAKLLTVIPVDNCAQAAPHRSRDAAFGRELCGMLVDVPWSGWEGYMDGSGFETGLVWRYGLFQGSKRFRVRFPPDAKCDDITVGLSDWGTM